LVFYAAKSSDLEIHIRIRVRVRVRIRVTIRDRVLEIRTHILARWTPGTGSAGCFRRGRAC